VTNVEGFVDHGVGEVVVSNFHVHEGHVFLIALDLEGGAVELEPRAVAQVFVQAQDVALFGLDRTLVVFVHHGVTVIHGAHGISAHEVRDEAHGDRVLRGVGVDRGLSVHVVDAVHGDDPVAVSGQVVLECAELDARFVAQLHAQGLTGHAFGDDFGGVLDCVVQAVDHVVAEHGVDHDGHALDRGTGVVGVVDVALAGPNEEGQEESSQDRVDAGHDMPPGTGVG
jgi:hypothetical protein